MTRARAARSRVALFVLPLLGLVLPLIAGARPSLEGPEPAHTGGFGEPTCGACHRGPPGAAEASLEVDGLPERWQADQTYRLDVVLRAAGLRRGGFQLAIRFTDGVQAGSLAGEEGRTRVTIHNNIAYAHHVATGTEPIEPGALRWTLHWTPPTRGGSVVIHAAGNAANDDNSEFGDTIVTMSRTIAGPGK